MEEVEYRDVECPVDDCTCEFGNSSDLKVHVESGVHGRMGDRFAEQNRRKFKYFTREGRMKEQIYREEGRTVEVPRSESMVSTEQQSLSRGPMPVLSVKGKEKSVKGGETK